MDDLDLSGVDPLRWAEIRQRVALIIAYLEIETPTPADQQRFATQLDLSASQFMALVRSWRDHGQASKLFGAGHKRRTTRIGTYRELPAEAKQAALDIIANVDLNMPVVDVVALVRENLTSRGLRAPSKGTIWNMLMETRRARSDPAQSKLIILGRCDVRLPMLIGETIDYPKITMAAQASSGAVLAATLRVTAGGPGDLIAAIAPPTVGNTLLVDTRFANSRAWDGLEVEFKSPASVRSALARTLGSGFGSIGLIYHRRAANEASSLLKTQRDKPITSGEAETLIRQAVRDHNATLNGPECVWR